MLLERHGSDSLCRDERQNKMAATLFFNNNLASCMDTHNSNLNMLIQRRAPKRGKRKKRKKLFRFS